MSLTKRQLCRIRALNQITTVVGAVNGINCLAWEDEANKFTSEADRKLIREEREKILWQLRNRMIKLEENL